MVVRRPKDITGEMKLSINQVMSTGEDGRRGKSAVAAEIMAPTVNFTEGDTTTAVPVPKETIAKTGIFINTTAVTGGDGEKENAPARRMKEWAMHGTPIRRVIATDVEVHVERGPKMKPLIENTAITGKDGMRGIGIAWRAPVLQTTIASAMRTVVPRPRATTKRTIPSIATIPATAKDGMTAKKGVPPKTEVIGTPTIKGIVTDASAQRGNGKKMQMLIDVIPPIAEDGIRDIGVAVSKLL